MDQPPSPLPPSSTQSSSPNRPEQPQNPSSSSAYSNPTTTATATLTTPLPIIDSLPTTTTQPLPTQSATSPSTNPNSAPLNPQSTQQQFTPSSPNPTPSPLNPQSIQQSNPTPVQLNPLSSQQQFTPSSPIPTSAPLNPQSTQQQFTLSHARPPLNRPWQQQQQQQPSNFSHYSPVSAQSSSTNSPAPALAVSPAPRSGIAIGVPAHHPSVATPSSSFSSINVPAYGSSSGGLIRNVSESALPSSSSQVGQPMGVGMMGSFGLGSAMQPPPGFPPHQLRPVQSTARPQPPSTPSFQGHGMMRVPSVGSPGPPSPNTSQSLGLQNQPWLSSGPQGKPPLPPASLRPQSSPQSVQQRSLLSHQHHHSTPTLPQQPLMTSIQQPQMTSIQQPQMTSIQQPQQLPTSVLPQEPYPQSRIQQSSLNTQQQTGRSQGTGVQRPQSALQSGAVQSGALNRAAAEPEETCDRILSKRSIQELVAQVDPLEKLDPEVEDILVDIADNFIESITTFGCSLAKHRKSTTLEAKDILLHLERNWNMSIPGFGGDELRTYKKPLTTDIHKERLAVIKKSVVNAETTHAKGSATQTGGNPKGHPAKGPSFVGSPAIKLREPT